MTKFIVAEIFVSSSEDPYFSHAMFNVVGVAPHHKEFILAEFREGRLHAQPVPAPASEEGRTYACAPHEATASYFEVEVDFDLNFEAALHARLEEVGWKVWPRRKLWKPLRRLLNWGHRAPLAAALKATKSRRTREYAERLLAAL